MTHLSAMRCDGACRRRVDEPGKAATDPAALHARYGDRIYRFCYRLCGRTDDAHDMAQDVFVAACQGVRSFQGRSSPWAWLYGIALNQWRSRQARRGPPPAPWEAAGSVAAPHADPARTVPEDLALARALESLSDELRETFLLVRAEGLTYREAAQALGIPQGTVQWRVHEAARRLRLLLEETDR